MLVKIGDLLKKAQRKKVAVGCFNAYNLETVLAIVEAAEELESSVIVATTPKAIEYAGLEYLSELVKKAASKSEVPVALHLDHGQDIEIVEECIKAGYTSIMIDGSHFPLVENIALTKKAAEITHKHKLYTEGELGDVSLGAKFTDPAEVPKFVKETGVDSLAVSIGSKHGHARNETLKLELLDKIKEKTRLPLVLHGSSGVTDTDIKGAIKRGVVKVNVDTILREVFTFAVRQTLKERMVDPRIYLKKAKEATKLVVKEKILLFGSMDV